MLEQEQKGGREGWKEDGPAKLFQRSKKEHILLYGRTGEGNKGKL